MAAGLGQIQEIDLGPEASERNIQRTEEARRRLAGVAVETPEEAPRDKEKPGKSGRRRRQQKRRNSEDMRRDMLVEAVLSEAKCNDLSFTSLLTQHTNKLQWTTLKTQSQRLRPPTLMKPPTPTTLSMSSSGATMNHKNHATNANQLCHPARGISKNNPRVQSWAGVEAPGPRCGRKKNRLQRIRGNVSKLVDYILFLYMRGSTRATFLCF